MAARKKAGAATPKAREPVASEEPPPPRQTAQATVGNSNRLLRGAAWNRMFGRVESKSPFSR